MNNTFHFILSGAPPISPPKALKGDPLTFSAEGLICSRNKSKTSSPFFPYARVFTCIQLSPIISYNGYFRKHIDIHLAPKPGEAHLPRQDRIVLVVRLAVRVQSHPLPPGDAVRTDVKVDSEGRRTDGIAHMRERRVLGWR